MKQQDINKELNEIAPSLSKLPKVKNRDVPEGYFRDLPNLTWDKIIEPNRNQKTQNKVLPIIWRAISIAACFVILFFIIEGTSDSSLTLVDELPVDELVDFIMEDVSDLDEALIYELHSASLDMAELEDDNLDYLIEEGIEDIDDQFLENLY